MNSTFRHWVLPDTVKNGQMLIRFDGTDVVGKAQTAHINQTRKRPSCATPAVPAQALSDLKTTMKHRQGKECCKLGLK